MLSWSYDYPAWVLGLAFLVVFLGASSGGIYLARRTVHPWIHAPGRSRENEMIGLALGNCFLVLGLLLGLVAVGAYQNYMNVGDSVDKEAAALAEFAQNAAAFPPGDRSARTSGLRAYIEATVERDWPAQRHGALPTEGTRALLALSASVRTFEPATEGQKTLQQLSLESLKTISEARRGRISMMQLGLPSVVWWVVGFGVCLNMALIWLQDMRAHVHYLLGAALSLSLGSVVFLTAVLENPFRGQTGVPPDSIQNIGRMLDPAPERVSEK